MIIARLLNRRSPAIGRPSPVVVGSVAAKNLKASFSVRLRTERTASPIRSTSQQSMLTEQFLSTSAAGDFVSLAKRLLTQLGLRS